jgi:hypothetical protein
MIVQKLSRWAFLTGAIVSGSLLFSAAAGAEPPVDITTGVNIPLGRAIYALSSDNAIYVLRPGAKQYMRVGRINPSDGGNVIGIDFRPADRSPTDFYALTDRGNLYLVRSSQAPNDIIASALVAQMGTRFTGGYLGVVDFNPVANALRVTGSNDQNLAVVNGANGENLATTVVQNDLAYALGDVNEGKDPEIVAGAYTNNFVGATATLFFMIDHDKDALVTIADRNAAGSSNTGGGRLQTVGPLVLPNGALFNASSASDFDIYTDGNGVNFLVGQSGGQLFSIDLNQVDPNLPLGTTQRIAVNAGPLAGNLLSVDLGQIKAALPRVAAQRLVGNAARLADDLKKSSPVTGAVFDLAIPTRP